MRFKQWPSGLATFRESCLGLDFTIICIYSYSLYLYYTYRFTNLLFTDNSCWAWSPAPWIGLQLLELGLQLLNLVSSSMNLVSSSLNFVPSSLNLVSSSLNLVSPPLSPPSLLHPFRSQRRRQGVLWFVLVDELGRWTKVLDGWKGELAILSAILCKPQL